MRLMLLTLVGRRGSGKSSVADYLIRKHKFTKMPAASALKTDTKDGFYVVDGPHTLTERNLDKLIDHGSAVWLVRRAGEPGAFKGRNISIVIENMSTLNDLQTAVEQKLWGCC